MNFKKDCTLVPTPASLNKSFKAIFLLILSMFTFFSCDGNVLGFHGDVIIQVYDNTTEEEIVRRTAIASDHGCIIAKVPENAPIEAELTFEFSIEINGTTYTENLSKGQVLVINNIPAGKIYSIRCTAKLPSGAVYAAGTAEANVMAGKISRLDLVLRRVSEDSNPDPLPTNVTVTFNSNGGSPVDPQTFTRGGKATRPADPTKAETTFLGWFEDLTNESAFDFDTEIDSDKILYAKWEDGSVFHGTAYHELDSGTSGTAGTGYTYVLFGDWPQTIKRNDVEVDETKSVEVGMFTYYKGSDGAWYAKIKEDAYGTNYKYSDGTDAAQSSANSYKFFKVEPIKWRVLTDNYSGKKLLLAENILAGCKFYDNRWNRVDGVPVFESEYVTYYPNDYNKSRIRAYLNGLSYMIKERENAAITENKEFVGKGFLQTAFTETQQSSIVKMTVDGSAASTTDEGGNMTNAASFVCGDTEDWIFLLSVNEVTRRRYGFSAYNQNGVGSTRIRTPTDLAIANGIEPARPNGYGSVWWLRSPCASYDAARVVHMDGDPARYNQPDFNNGVVPALCVNP